MGTILIRPLVFYTATMCFLLVDAAVLSSICISIIVPVVIRILTETN